MGRAGALGLPVTGRRLLGLAARFRGTSPGLLAQARVLEVAEALADACRAERVPALVGSLDDERAGALLALDCVTSLGGMPVEVDAWGVDAAGSCSQKCLGAPPGLGPVTFSPRAMERVRSRTTKPSTWYLDLQLVFQYWGESGGPKERAFHHTAPVSSIYGFHEALRIILDEGPEARWKRHLEAPEHFVAEIVPGKVLYEMGGVDEALVRDGPVEWTCPACSAAP